MKLNLDQIRSVTSGAVQITQETDGFHFFRFTKEQMELEHPYVPHLKRKFCATAGIKLSFRTDSCSLYLRTDMTIGSGRGYYALDVVVNGVLCGGIDNFSHLELPDNYTELVYERAVHETDIELGEGEKEVSIYFPWGACTVLQELALDDGSHMDSLVPSKKILVFGDSIAQGYDVLRPSCHHVSKLGLALDAAVYNKALGGAVSFPELAQARESFDPDYILVAYGTNDWRKIPLDDFLIRYRALLTAVGENYPAAQVFLVTPIWRKDSDVTYAAGPFSDIARHIHGIAADFPSFHIIYGMDLIPHKESFYADQYLHPNDDGFDQYFNHLWPQIERLVTL